MDRQKFSTIAHSNHQFFGPISPEKVRQFIGLMPVNPTDQVLDVGCGQADVLIQICERYQAQGVGVDINPEFIAKAQNAASERLAENQIIFHNKAIQDCTFEPASFALALCIGSLHAYGDYSKTIEALFQLVRSGGVILLGEGYWKKKPDPEYLAFLGGEEEVHVSHARNIEIAEELGLIPLYSVTSNPDEWDEYEGLYCRAIELYTHAHPQDPDSLAMQERIRTWRKAYHKWGRDTLGFGLYLFLRP